MGIYLGQLPPAEIARLKAELAETLIANFCYPRFYDHRTASLQMRPVDRAKRQEVWLFLSSVDFTAWNRVDLMSPDLQGQIERLFIQFVQRNRSFFSEQGRKRLSDIRMLINSNSTAVVQRLRSHLAGQKSNNPPFGSPRPVVSWGTPVISGRAEPGWEQISASTMLLQQQLQELRGEARPAGGSDGRLAAAAANGAGRPAARPQAATQVAERVNGRESVVQQPTIPTTPMNPRTPTTPPPSPAPEPRSIPPSEVKGIPARPAASINPTIVPPRPSGPLMPSADPTPAARKSDAVPVAPTARLADVPPTTVPVSPGPVASNGTAAADPAPIAASAPARPLSATASAVATAAPSREAMMMGEDDVAIFEQMRHQLLIWLRVEAVKAGLDVAGQGPSQLLDQLRQQARLDETHLQVVSTLLNLSNQVIKTGIISVLDYKQALMFHLMHTRG